VKVLGLIRTAPDFPPGSMVAYAKLVAKAMEGSPDFKVEYCDLFDPDGGSSMRRHHIWRMLHARSFFDQHPADLYHLLDGSMAGFLPKRTWNRTVVTVHDLIPVLQMKGGLPGAPSIMGCFLIHRALRVLLHVKGILAVSEQTASDIHSYVGRSDVAIVPHPVRVFPAKRDAGRLPLRYIFHVGNNAEYKNREGVLDVFSKLQDVQDLKLIMAGPAPSKALLRKAKSLSGVAFRVDISDAELYALYENASVFLFPSLYEGFGMPIHEAMAAGCPVVCSRSASLPAVAGDAALMAPANDIHLLANHCRRVLENPELRSRMIHKGHQHVANYTMNHLSNSLTAWYLSAC
jgi:glycosyltransferase involved in cell wall biosynthesis